jgi:two-component system catabolic regulation response regulator CreB
MEAEHCLLGREVVPRVRAGGVDVVVLDVGLPDRSGFDVCRELRSSREAWVSEVPVIFLTARNDEIDRVLGLELGADDYMAKPFSPRELVARVRARLRRHAATGVTGDAPVDGDGWTGRGDFAVDRSGHRIRYRDQALDLTRYEYVLLEALLQRPGAILSRAQLMDRGWDSDADSSDRTVDTHIKTLRAKLRAAGAEPDPIRTHRGVGYAIEA